MPNCVCLSYSLDHGTQCSLFSASVTTRVSKNQWHEATQDVVLLHVVAWVTGYRYSAADDLVECRGYRLVLISSISLISTPRAHLPSPASPVNLAVWCNMQMWRGVAPGPGYGSSQVELAEVVVATTTCGCGYTNNLPHRLGSTRSSTAGNRGVRFRPYVVTSYVRHHVTK